MYSIIMAIMVNVMQCCVPCY